MAMSFGPEVLVHRYSFFTSVRLIVIWLVWGNRGWLPIEAEIFAVSALGSFPNLSGHNGHLLVLGFPSAWVSSRHHPTRSPELGAAFAICSTLRVPRFPKFGRVRSFMWIGLKVLRRLGVRRWGRLDSLISKKEHRVI